MKEFILKHKYGLIFVLPGLILGFLYWKFVGCTSGTCPITANWHTMVLFGGLIGYFLGDSLDDLLTKRKNKKEKNGEL